MKKNIPQTKQAQKLTDEVFNKMRAEVSDFFNTHEQITTSMEYENKIFELAQKFAAGMVSAGAGQLPKDRNSKKSFNDMG